MLFFGVFILAGSHGLGRPYDGGTCRDGCHDAENHRVVRVGVLRYFRKKGVLLAEKMEYKEIAALTIELERVDQDDKTDRI